MAAIDPSAGDIQTSDICVGNDIVFAVPRRASGGAIPALLSEIRYRGDRVEGIQHWSINFDSSVDALMKMKLVLVAINSRYEPSIDFIKEFCSCGGHVFLKNMSEREVHHFRPSGNSDMMSLELYEHLRENGHL